MNVDEKRILLFCATVCKFVTDSQIRATRKQIESLVGNVAKNEPRFKEHLATLYKDVRDLEKIVEEMKPLVGNLAANLAGTTDCTEIDVIEVLTTNPNEVSKIEGNSADSSV